jgi:hypothetical protein
MTMARSESCTAKAWAILLVVFLGGVASGVLVQRAVAPTPPGTPEIAAAHSQMEPTEAVEHLESELSLTQDQTLQVRGILDECIMQEADLMKQIEMIKTQGRERITQVLDEPQRSKFQKLLQASTR